MAGRQRPPLEPDRVYGAFVNANGTAFVLRASASGKCLNLCLHHDEGPQIAVVRNPTVPAERSLRWQGRLWSSNPPAWKREVKQLAFAAIDAALTDSRDAEARP